MHFGFRIRFRRSRTTPHELGKGESCKRKAVEVHFLLRLKGRVCVSMHFGFRIRFGLWNRDKLDVEVYFNTFPGSARTQFYPTTLQVCFFHNSVSLRRSLEMLNFLHKIVTLSGKTHRIFHNHSLPKPSPLHISGSFLSHQLLPFHPRRLEHTVSVRFRGFISGPVLARHFMLNSSNSLRRLSSGRGGGSRPKLSRDQFHGKSLDVNQNSRSRSDGWRSWFQGLTSNDLVLGLIIANVAVFTLWKIADKKFMSENFTISLHNFKCGRLHTLITSAFGHANAPHIFSTMIGLFFFGTNIGSVFGAGYLLKLYLAGAVGGSVFYLVHQAYKAQTSKGTQGTDVWQQQAYGASGAVNAVMLLHIFLFPKATVYVDMILPVPAALFAIYLIGRDVLRIIEGDSHVSGSAHLGGIAVAAIAWARVRKGRF